MLPGGERALDILLADSEGRTICLRTRITLGRA